MFTIFLDVRQRPTVYSMSHPMICYAGMTIET
jgi:hypothetical protein